MTDFTKTILFIVLMLGVTMKYGPRFAGSFLTMRMVTGKTFLEWLDWPSSHEMRFDWINHLKKLSSKSRREHHGKIITRLKY